MTPPEKSAQLAADIEALKELKRRQEMARESKEAALERECLANMRIAKEVTIGFHMGT